MSVHLLSGPLDPWDSIRRHQAGHPELQGKAGATAVFVGTMRDFNQGQAVQAMTLEHYPAMTEKQLEQICAEARAQWPLLDILLEHRYGELQPNDPIVLVAVWSAHRDSAFAACRYLTDTLKTRAPFWKQELTPTGRRWVSQDEEK